MRMIKGSFDLDRKTLVKVLLEYWMVGLRVPMVNSPERTT